MKELAETRISSTHIFTGKLLDVWSDEVRLPDGKSSVREYIKHPGAVVMIPLLPDGRIALIRQFRYAIGEVEIELPAGKIDGGESLEEAVHRELAEEISYQAGRITKLAEIHPCIGYSNERIWIFLAENLRPCQVNRDREEFIEVFPTQLSDAVEMVWSGRITDVKTIIGLLWADRLLS